MLSKPSFTYYQPDRYYDDGTNVEWLGMPDGLFSFQAFRSEEECIAWLENNGYDPGDFTIHEYCDDDIEGVQIIDEYGDVMWCEEAHRDAIKTVMGWMLGEE